MAGNRARRGLGEAQVCSGACIPVEIVRNSDFPHLRPESVWFFPPGTKKCASGQYQHIRNGKGPMKTTEGWKGIRILKHTPFLSACTSAEITCVAPSSERVRRVWSHWIIHIRGFFQILPTGIMSRYRDCKCPCSKRGQEQRSNSTISSRTRFMPILYRSCDQTVIAVMDASHSCSGYHCCISHFEDTFVAKKTLEVQNISSRNARANHLDSRRSYNVKGSQPVIREGHSDILDCNCWERYGLLTPLGPRVSVSLKDTQVSILASYFADWKDALRTQKLNWIRDGCTNCQ